MTAVAQGAERGQKLIGPIIEERLKVLKEYGDEKAEKPVSSFPIFARIEGAHPNLY